MDNKSVVKIADSNKKETQISETTKLFTTDSFALIEQGGATAKINSSSLDIDEKTQFSYSGSSQNNENISLTKGRIWITAEGNTILAELKRLNAKIPSGNIAMIEQTNSAFSVVYAIRGDIDIITSIGQYTLKPGQGIKISDSNLNNIQTKLSDLVDEIDASVLNNQVFARNNGEEILKQATTTQTETKTEDKNENASTTENPTKYIAFTQPIDGSTVKTNSMNIMGTLLNTEVTRVTINDVDSAVSPVNQTFVLQDFKLTNEINNIVYKVYDVNNTRLEMGVLVVYGPKNGTSTQTTIIPQNYPVSDKDFPITSPNKNPYATTDNYVRVQGKVPKGTVKYITVNDYRLTKFVPNSDTWYYHANASIGTLRDGMNLYYIKFFDNNDKLIHTQPLTIIKDSKTITPANNESLFP